MDGSGQRSSQKRPLENQDTQDLVETQNKKPTGLQFYLDENWNVVYNSEPTSTEPSAINPVENQTASRCIGSQVQHESQPSRALDQLHRVRTRQPQHSGLLYSHVPVRQQQQLLPVQREQTSTSVNALRLSHPPQGYPGSLQNILNRLPNFSWRRATPSPNIARTNQPQVQIPQHLQNRSPLFVPVINQAGPSRVPIPGNQAPPHQQNVAEDSYCRLSNFSWTRATPFPNSTRMNQSSHHQVQQQQAEVQLPQCQHYRLPLLVPGCNRAEPSCVPIPANQIPRQELELHLHNVPQDNQAGPSRVPIDHQAPSQQQELHPQNAAEGSDEVMPNSTDPGWKYARTIKHGQQIWVKCNFCGKEIHLSSGITRIKKHLAWIGNEITKCPAVPEHIRQEMRANVTRPKPCYACSRAGA